MSYKPFVKVTEVPVLADSKPVKHCLRSHIIEHVARREGEGLTQVAFVVGKEVRLLLVSETPEEIESQFENPYRVSDPPEESRKYAKARKLVGDVDYALGVLLDEPEFLAYDEDRRFALKNLRERLENFLTTEE